MVQRNTALAVGVLAGALVVSSASGAAAALLVTGANVKDGSLTGVDIMNGSLRGADVRDGSLTGVDVANGTLGGSDIRDGSLSALDLSSAARRSLQGAPGPVGPTGPAGPSGAPGPAGPAGTTFHTYTGSASRAFPAEQGLPAEPPADRSSWTLVLGTTLPANAYESLRVELSTPYNYNNPDGLNCAVFLGGALVATGAHQQNATSPWTFTDVAAQHSAGNEQQNAEYVGVVFAGAPSYPGDLDIQVRCFKAAGVSTSVDVSVRAELPLVKTLAVTSDPA